MFVRKGLYRVNFLLSKLLFPSLYFIFTPCLILRCVNPPQKRRDGEIKRLDERKVLFPVLAVTSYKSRKVYVVMSSCGKATHTHRK